MLDGETAGLEGGEGLVSSCLLPVPASLTSAVALDLMVSLGFRLQLFFFFFFFDTLRTSLVVPLRSTSPGSATSSDV